MLPSLQRANAVWSMTFRCPEIACSKVSSSYFTAAGSFSGSAVYTPSTLVDYYGTPTPVPQVASVSAPDARTLLIQPWEKSMIAKIEKSIMDANLGLTPSNNGESIRCVVPALTEERRKELIKKAKAAGENAKVVVRNARRDAVEQLKKAQKNEGLTEDAQKEGEDEVQKITDKNVKLIDEIISAKEKDIMTV